MATTIYGLGDSNFSAAAPLNDAKVNHRHRFVLSQTGTVVAAKQYWGPIRVAGALLSLWAAITETIATGADRTVTIDLKKSTGAGAFASVLSATLVLNNVSVLYAAVAATISTFTLAANDILQLSTAVAGAAGNQALGLVIGAELWEAPS